MKTSYPKMRAILSAALALALLAGIPTAALAEGEGSVLPPPAVEEGVPLPETDGQIPADQAEVPETLPEDGGLFPAPEITEPETEELFPAEPETAVPPTEEPLADVTAPEQTFDAEPAADTAALVGTEWDDPLYHKRMEQAGQISTASLTSDSFGRFTPRALNANEALRRGVDVSGYQLSVDWTKARQSGVEFAIVRTSYRGSTTGALCTDSWYKQNLSGAHAAGVKVGAYIFSQATTVEEAREEARFLIDTVKGYTIDLPLVFDYEETGNSDRRLKMSKLSRQTKIDICNAFCQEVEQAGYQSMVYSNPSTISSHLDRSQIKRLWLAHYTTKTDYSGPYEYWQCGYGNVEGVPGTVDLDFWFEPNGVSVPPLNEEQVSPTASPTPAPSATPAPTPTPASTPVPGASPTPSPEPETPAATPPAATPPAVVPPQNVVNPFKDVSAGKWYYNSVLWAYGKGIVNGLSSTSFGPNATATRGQLVAMLYRMQGQPAVTGASGFTDLVEDYYRDAVTWASHNGIVSGFTQTLFGPNNKVTREQLAAMLYRMAGSPAVTGDLSLFTDAGSVHSYSVSALVWAVGKGVVTGYDDGTIKPAEPATRAEVCTMMGRFAALG